MHGTRITVYAPGGVMIGHIWHSDCDNQNCMTAVVNGRPWHACPAGQGVTLHDYHFATVDQAIRNLMEVYR